VTAALRGRRLVALVVAVLVASALGIVLLGRHWLEDWNDELDRRWAPLRPALDVRYEKLGALDRQFRDEYGGERPFNRRIERLLRRWDRLSGQRDIAQEDEVDTANALELAAGRLIRYTQASTARRPSPELEAAMLTYARSVVPSPELPRFNRAARAYEETRDSILGAPAAHLLAYYGRSPLGLTIL
jgi:hypothetical protein